MKKVDLIIIGGGPAGYETALLASKKGKQTILIESKWLGGACLNEGCIPTKSLCRSAEIKRLLENNAFLEELGIECVNKGFDVSKAISRKNKVVASLGDGIKSMLKAAKVEIVYGNAFFKSSHVVEVESANEEQYDTEYTADNIFVATGAETKFLPINGAHSDGVLTSRELLNLEIVPKDICIIGGGVIGTEFASIYSAFGSKVSVIEYCPEILPNFDRDIAKRLRMGLTKKGVCFHLNSSVSGIEKTDTGRMWVRYTSKNEEKCTDAEIVLMATGRVANTEKLNLNAAGIAVGKRGIEVDENFETSAKGVYAIGDVNGIFQLAHVAKFQGKRALAHILGEPSFVDFNIVPAVVFTTPELSMVGLTEEDCKDKGIAFKSHKAFYRANGKAMASGETDGLIKILTSPEGNILGAHILGEHASDLIHEVVMAMRFSRTISDISNIIHAHPTLSELVLDASEN